MITRRGLLGGVVAAGALVACDAKKPRRGVLGLMERVNERIEGTFFRNGSRARPEADGALTPDDAFPVYYIGATVPIAPFGWRLEIDGLVDRPAKLSLEELMRLPATSQRIRHHCVEGWSAVADWNGVRLADLAAHVGASKGAKYVEFRSFDAGYWSSWDRDSAFHRSTMVAYGMNGKPLGPDHGAPARIYSAVKLGYKNVKYLTSIRFLAEKTGGYWEDQGYEWYGGV